MEIITRKQAKLAGRVDYYTGKPCIHGHFSKRYVKGAICAECKNERAKQELLEINSIRQTKASG